MAVHNNVKTAALILNSETSEGVINKTRDGKSINSGTGTADSSELGQAYTILIGIEKKRPSSATRISTLQEMHSMTLSREAQGGEEATGLKPQEEAVETEPSSQTYNCVVGSYEVTMPNVDGTWSPEVVQSVREAGGFQSDAEAQLWLGATMAALAQVNPDHANPHQMTEQWVRTSEANGTLKAWGSGLQALVGQHVDYTLTCPPQ